MNAESFRTLPLQPREWSEGRAEFDVAGHGRSDSATLVERSASDSLRHATHSSDPVNTSSRGPI